MEDHVMTQDSVKSCGLLTKEDEREKVKDFVYRHLMNERAVLTKGHCRAQQGAVFSGKILSFGCSECKDSATYSPNDLLKHFRAAHCGTLPTYPCDLCGFVTNEFSVLQRHRIEHRDTLVTCELCHDGVQYSLLLLTRHYNMCHSLNGQFTCHWCHFTTVDAGTFVQHIHHHKETTWKCAKCSRISLNEEEHQKHLKSHSGTFPFTCPMCGYGCARNDYLKKHMAAVHKSEKKSVWTAIEDNGAPLNSPTSLKLLLKKTSPPSGESKEDNQITKVNIGPGVKSDTNDRLALSIEVTGEPQQKAQDTLAKRDNRNGKNSNNEVEPSAVDMLQEAEHSLSSDSGQISPNGMTVLRVKNKLSLPPNCTTKVIGFKMVDGKKHLVLKVIQASKQDDSAQPDPREFSNGRNSSMDCLQADDIMTVKVKVEEEETTVSNVESSPNGAGISNDLNCSPFSDGHLMLKNCDKDTSPHHQTACGQRTVKDRNTAQFSASANPTESSAHVENSEVTDAGVLSHSLALTLQATLDTSAKESDKNGQDVVTEASSNSSRADENCTKTLPTQEVYTFHNYSKETTSSSSDFGHSTFELSAEREAVSPEFGLTLAESPDPGIREPADESICEQRSSECSSNVEVDGCVSDVEVEENPESVLQDFNIIKIEEDNIPITKPPSNQFRPAADGFVNEHSDTVITQHPNKETTESAGCSESTDSTKQTKTTLRILQLQEGQQPVLLRTAAESRLAVPVQVKAPHGFKLITNSTNPHINVSYMKPAGEKTTNSGVVLGSNSKVIGVPAGKGAALLTSSKQGITSSSNHYLITSDLKRPLLLPRVLNGTPSDKTKTCYVVQRSSLPVVQSPPAPGLKLSGTQLSLNSRPLLAVPVSSAENTGNLQSARQTFLLRYVPPSKSGLTVSSQETKVIKPAGPCNQPNDSTGNKLIFKIVSPPNSALSHASPVSQNHPVLLATRPQTQCFLLSSNNPTAGIKKIIAVQSASQNIISEARVVQSSVKVQSSDSDKPVRAPRPIRPPSQRKRRRKLLFDELPVTNHKVRKVQNKALPEKETDVLWSPVAKDKERTLRLYPQSSDQQVKWPRKHQPVVVLNHPDVDIPEVASIMKVVHRHQGAVTKVSLSQKTIQALDLSVTDSSTKDKSQSDCPHPRTVQSLVRERYLLKLKLKRKNRKKYRLVRTVPNLQQSVVFTCWFCGRLFNSQEAWIGHGQRHLLEATRDWNTLV